MQSILEKACQTLAGENMAAASGGGGGGSFKTICNNMGTTGNLVSDAAAMGGGAIKDFISPHPNAFPPFQDINIFTTEPPPPALIDCLKKPGPFISGAGKTPIFWPDDLRLQDLGTSPPSLALPPPPPSIGPADLDSLQLEMYESKPSPMLTVGGGDGMNEKKFDMSLKLERPSPHSDDRMNGIGSNNPTMSQLQGRNSSFG